MRQHPACPGFLADTTPLAQSLLLIVTKLDMENGMETFQSLRHDEDELTFKYFLGAGCNVSR
jgi:hypothetical protein